LEQDLVYEERVCGDFFERVPDLTPLEHFNTRQAEMHLVTPTKRLVSASGLPS